MKVRNSEHLTATRQLTEQLKVKGRIRREALKTITRADNANSASRNDLLPDLQLVMIALDDLKVATRKTRKHSPEHLREIMQTISRLGFCAPVLVGKGNEVIDGEARLEAARQIGLLEIPCIQVTHLSEAERRSLRLAINRLGEKAEWDIETLKLEMEELIVLNAPMHIIGFSADEIDQIILNESGAAVEAGALEPDPDAEPVAKPGDIFHLGQHRLVCGDATDPSTFEDLFSGVSNNQARLVLTDEPYNVRIAGHVSGGKHREFVMASGEMSDTEFQAFNKAWIRSVLPYLCDGGLLATFIDWRGLHVVHEAALSHGLAQLNLIVWAKTNAGQGSHYRSAHELLPLYKKGKEPHINNIKLGKNGRYRSNLWTYPGASSLGSDARRGLQDHPTVKPTAMLEDALVDITNRGEIVVDPFLGSGSTLLAAERTGRICYGIEIDPIYVDLICRRYNATTGDFAIHAETGQRFGALSTAME
jgi:DNA modification methylase